MKYLSIEGNRNCYSPEQVSSITVRELKDILEWYDDDLPVYLRNDEGYTYGSLSESDFEEREIDEDEDEDDEDDEYEDDEEEDFEESCTGKLVVKEEFSGYDVRSLLDQIETKWGFDTMDKMLDWLVEYSDNGDDQLDEYGYYVPEELEFWIGSSKIEDVMTRCLETGVIEESLRNKKFHIHESHKVRKNKLYIKKAHKHNDKISKY